MQHLQPNTTLQSGKYRIERVLGQGGFGITYLAEQVSLGRKVAIKEFFMKDLCGRGNDTRTVETPSTGSSKQVELYRRKFIKEARNLARLNHPNIISVLDVFEENGSVYYAMPFISGGSLQNYVNVEGTLSEMKAMKYIKQIASALKYMHEEEHICHYDVKPANILLDDKGNAILIDFGISKNYDAAGHETTTTPIGLSEGYAPIEQYQQDVEEFSPASDVYALGATLYFLLHGKSPVSAVKRAGGIPLMMSKSLSQDVKDIINAAMKVSKLERANSVDVFFYEQEVGDGNESPNDNPPKPLRKSVVKKILGYIINFIISFVSGIYILSNVNFNDLLCASNLKLLSIIIIIIVLIEYIDDFFCKDPKEKDSVIEQFNLGVRYYYGDGVPQIYSEAVKWFRKAAEQGNANAQYNLGVCYENGDGVPQNYSEAVKWYKRAAEQGDANAQYKLGVCYEGGFSVPQNYSKAAKWYRKAAEQGHADAQDGLGFCYENGRGVPQDYSVALKWYRKAAEKGNANGQSHYNLLKSK